MQLDQIFVLFGEFVLRNGNERAVQIIDAVEEIFGETLQCKVLGGLDFSFGLFLEVAVVGYGAFNAVLFGRAQLCCR